MTLLSALCATVLILYSGFLCFLLVRLLFSPVANSMKNPGPFPGVSVVIPFRNEANNLVPLLNSLESQEYHGNYEVILVNDCSTDDYKTSTTPHQWRMPVRTIQSHFSEDRRLTSKQQALDTGIKEAINEWIAFTDADMALKPDWLESLMRPACRGAKLVFGHTVIFSEKTQSVFAWFQKFQLETLFAAAYAFSNAGLTGSCMGNNLLISRKSYMETGGFDTLGYSIVEDMTLMSAFRKQHLKTSSTEPFSATATTLPAATLNDFFQQLRRWAHGGFRYNPLLIFANSLLSIQNVILVLALFHLLPPVVPLIAIGNFFLTWLFTAAAFRKMKTREYALLFPMFYVLYLFESLVLGYCTLINKPIIWKSRRIA
jgi:cellulose synthase/poly-beta-1,6-N-acetylglucosamine synthase-like glycosyltransferase